MKSYIPVLAMVVLAVGGGTSAFSSSSGTDEARSVQPKSYANSRNNSTCLACHGQLDYLRSVSKDTKDGYGHPVTAETVAQGLYVSPEFVNDRIHGNKSCEFCHGGDPTSTDPAKAHKNMVADPTSDGGKKFCSPCHKGITEKFDTSIHFRQSGISTKLSERLGTTPHKDKMVGKIMEKDCRTCHATCGTCHVGTAPVANAGLQKNHVFKRKGDNLQVCIPCHHLAGAGFFTQEKNLHAALGMDCISCHNTEQQFHGRGGPEEPQGMMTPGLIEANCYNCHQKADSSNQAHAVHNSFVACQSCHGTEYESCISCHNRVPKMEHIFKLGTFNGKIFPFVHSTGNTSAEMFKHLDIKLNQKDLENKPTWMPYPTHFLQKAPIHKKGASVMCENCHGNSDIFLGEDDLTFPDLEKQYLVKPPRALTKGELEKVKKDYKK